MGKHVLLIEDEPNISEAIRFILTRDGFRVSCHDQGRDALEVVRAERPDALILDAMLPGRTGYDILRDLRAEPDTALLPVLMLTARGQGRDRELAESAGASGFMAKPFSNAEVLASVRALLGQA
ncbi:response regulator receiver protein [Gemmobacter megaterium]|uniref:Response regulator receiver protein n=1 Tax=Gemmobacter megaterium TaxID=1086013 RepID=A0A1N7JZI1_9RHOB|nr:response regulator [Gemmobacter megaterium]GGD99710.1 response regulator [Gemmobacter megaterium]SIS54745.1 response regulator receiver protein [Gemmobacter megaterium]